MHDSALCERKLFIKFYYTNYQFTSIGIPSTALPVTSAWIADINSICSGKIAKPVTITSAITKFSQHRAQSLLF